MINPKLKRLAESLERDENVEADSGLALLRDTIGTGKRVLEFGCASGELSRLLVAAGNRVTGVETSGAEAAAARESCEDVVVADLDARPLLEALPSRAFDAVVFAGVLEFVRDPRRVLDDARRFLAPGGYAVLAIPNVAHGANRLALLRGHFDVSGGTSFERSAPRLFTLESIHELCFRAGYRIVEIERAKSPLFPSGGSSRKLEREDFDREILREIESDPEHDTTSFIVRASPLGDDERLTALVDIAVQAEMRFNEARSQFDRAEIEVEAAVRRAAEIESDLSEVAALRERLQRAERDVVEWAARSSALPDIERSLAEAAERAAALAARADVLAEQLELAQRRAETSELRSDALRAERAAFAADAASLREALERANAELTDVRRALGDEVAQVRAALAASSHDVELARAAVDEANRERDAAVAAKGATESEARALANALNDANNASGKRAAAIEDLRFELEREAMVLRDVVADRDRIRAANEAQQSAVSAFFAHVEAELARTRREIAHIDGMIRQVQSSKWWTAKRALGKLRRIVVARLRR